MPRIVTYECVQCGTEVIVNENFETKLRPIYCCGIRVEEVAAIPKPEMKKKPVKKPARALTGKVTAVGSRPAKAKKTVKSSPAKTKEAAPRKTASRSRK